ncbi:dethiobiotin synthase [Paenibacillus roseipurpureus]|uniref:ATP-dependent dethiobiotin synthetase BioD n=1 Tax=Paenibacillus roseopurpureus TaxID=2918901 RepID=A0AA96LND6_9BACL|nr:dethiobiotin synthase [Paenibacillus sp. MBLB1832]WNR44940.1 dethiobiotin synthase [Paenibacillus sp. MBLB1832]
MIAKPGVFITGTDTGVGKTLLTAALCAAFRAEGLHIGVWKPVQSGARLGSGLTDGERLLAYTGLPEWPERVAPFTFEAPLTPMLAAKQAGVSLTLQEIVAAGQPLIQSYDGLLVEGAGGVAVPLTEDTLIADFIAELRLPAVLIARSGLGTINLTLLTAAYLRQHGIPILGVILNDGEGAAGQVDASVESNAALIEQYGQLSVLGRFPRIDGEVTAQTLVPLVCANIQLAPIRDALFGR